MKLKKGGGGEKFPRVEDGTYMGRIIQLVGLGEHERDDRYPEKGTCDKLIITAELPTEMININDEEKPRFQSKTENMFLTERSNLYKLIKAAIPKFDIDKVDEFDFNELLGKPIMVTIGSTAKGNAKITGFTGVVKGLKVPKQISDSVMFDFYEPDVEVFGKLMEWVQGEIKDAENFPGSSLAGMLGEGGDDGESTGGGAAGADMGEDVPFAPIF